MIISDKKKNILKIDDKYLYYNFYEAKSNGNKTWRCTNYKLKEKRCNSIIITNSSNKPIQWDTIHNHLTDRITLQRKRVKSEIKNVVKKFKILIYQNKYKFIKMQYPIITPI